MASPGADVSTVTNYMILHTEAPSDVEHLCLGIEIFIDGALGAGDFFHLTLDKQTDILVELMDIVALPADSILLGSLATKNNALENSLSRQLGWRQHGFATDKSGKLVGINLSPLCDEIVPTSHWNPLQGAELLDLINSGLIDSAVSAVPMLNEKGLGQGHATEDNVISLGDWKESQTQRHRFGVRP